MVSQNHILQTAWVLMFQMCLKLCCSVLKGSLPSSLLAFEKFVGARHRSGHL